jgi:hypothetical protein
MVVFGHVALGVVASGFGGASAMSVPSGVSLGHVSGHVSGHISGHVLLNRE